MSDREKLIEILSVPIYPHLDADPAEVVADYLIDNGVTVQKWIPVSERLPEDDSHVLVARKNGDVDTDMHIYTWWKVGPVERNITHWMPLPEPPKECE